MDKKLTWKEICFLLQKEFKDEKEFQTTLIRFFECLNYKEYLGEIKKEYSIAVGSVNKIRVDFLIQHSGESIFATEVKKPTLYLAKKNFKEQLTSYMRLLKLDYGILIGNTIQIFYDDREKETSFLLLKEIEIKEDNPEGEIFVSHFYKETNIQDLKEKLKKYKNKCLEKIEQEKEIKHLKQEILKFSNEDLQKFFFEKYKKEKENFNEEKYKEILANIFEKIEIKIFNKKKEKDENISSQKNEQENFSENETGEPSEKRKEFCKSIGRECKIGEYVKYTVKDFFNRNLISKEELENCLNKNYTKNTFKLSLSFLIKEEHLNSKNRVRYYKEKIVYNENNYYLCSQWVESHWRNFRTWENKIKNQS